MPITVIIKPDSALSAEERALFARWDAAYFGPQEQLQGYQWAPAQWRAMVADAGTLVSHLDITLRQALHGGEPLLVGGIGSVMTPPELRGHGYARLALDHARSFLLDEQQVDAGLLLCLPPLCPFYVGLGWQPLQSPLVFAQEQGSITWPHATMVLPREPDSWHDAPIDLCGLPW